MRSETSPRAVSISVGALMPLRRSSWTTSKPFLRGQSNVENQQVRLVLQRACQSGVAVAAPSGPRIPARPARAGGGQRGRDCLRRSGSRLCGQPRASRAEDTARLTGEQVRSRHIALRVRTASSRFVEISQHHLSASASHCLLCDVRAQTLASGRHRRWSGGVRDHGRAHRDRAPGGRRRAAVRGDRRRAAPSHASELAIRRRRHRRGAPCRDDARSGARFSSGWWTARALRPFISALLVAIGHFVMSWAVGVGQRAPDRRAFFRWVTDSFLRWSFSQRSYAACALPFCPQPSPVIDRNAT